MELSSQVPWGLVGWGPSGKAVGRLQLVPLLFSLPALSRKGSTAKVLRACGGLAVEGIWSLAQVSPPLEGFSVKWRRGWLRGAGGRPLESAVLLVHPALEELVSGCAPMQETHVDFKDRGPRRAPSCSKDTSSPLGVAGGGGGGRRSALSLCRRPPDFSVGLGLEAGEVSGGRQGFLGGWEWVTSELAWGRDPKTLPSLGEPGPPSHVLGALSPAAPGLTPALLRLSVPPTHTSGPQCRWSELRLRGTEPDGLRGLQRVQHRPPLGALHQGTALPPPTARPRLSGGLATRTP